MESDDSSQWSEGPAIGPSPRPDESNPVNNIMLVSVILTRNEWRCKNVDGKRRYNRRNVSRTYAVIRQLFRFQRVELIKVFRSRVQWRTFLVRHKQRSSGLAQRNATRRESSRPYRLLREGGQCGRVRCSVWLPGDRRCAFYSRLTFYNKTINTFFFCGL